MDHPTMPLEADAGAAPEEARDWEAKIFRQTCAEAQRQAVAHLEMLDEVLFAQRPAGWVAVGFRERTLVTGFGEVCLRRRLYRDGWGWYRRLLDEYLGQVAHQAATPDTQAICTALGSMVSFRKAAACAPCR